MKQRQKRQHNNMDVDCAVEDIDTKAHEFADPLSFMEQVQSELAYCIARMRQEREETGA